MFCSRQHEDTTLRRDWRGTLTAWALCQTRTTRVAEAIIAVAWKANWMCSLLFRDKPGHTWKGGAGLSLHLGKWTRVDCCQNRPPGVGITPANVYWKTSERPWVLFAYFEFVIHPTALNTKPYKRVCGDRLCPLLKLLLHVWFPHKRTLFLSTSKVSRGKCKHISTPSPLKIYFYYLYVCVCWYLCVCWCVCVGMCAWVQGSADPNSQIPLDLDLQAFVIPWRGC